MSLRAKIETLPVPRIARFTAVVAIAMAAGHLAQTLAVHQPAPLAAAETQALPTRIEQLSSGGTADVPKVRVNPEPHLLALEKPGMLRACTVNLTLKALPSAMLGVALTAPCHDGERVVLHQAGLAITGKIGADGRLAVVLPALTADGAVAVLFADGSRADQVLPMPEAANLRRFGVQWQGAAAFVLHGMEDGADFDPPGDISGRNPVGAGFLTVLGDAAVENPLLAQVYTYPVAAEVRPEIVLEAAVLPATCGHDLLGEVLTVQSGQVQKTDLTLAMPDCSGVGDFLVLKNLASDVKVAAN